MGHKKTRLGRPLGPASWRTPKGLAARIVARRLALGLSQEKAAAQLGVAHATFAKWELGREPRGLYRAAVEAWIQQGGQHGRSDRR